MNQTWINLFCPHELSTHHFKSAKVVLTTLWVCCISSHVIFHGEPNAAWISSSYSFSSEISSPASSSLSHNTQQPEQYGHGHNSWKNPTCIIIFGICNITVIIIIKMPVVAYQNGIKTDGSCALPHCWAMGYDSISAMKPFIIHPFPRLCTYAQSRRRLEQQEQSQSGG